MGWLNGSMLFEKLYHGGRGLIVVCTLLGQAQGSFPIIVRVDRARSMLQKKFNDRKVGFPDSVEDWTFTFVVFQFSPRSLAKELSNSLKLAEAGREVKSRGSSLVCML